MALRQVEVAPVLQFVAVEEESSELSYCWALLPDPREDCCLMAPYPLGNLADWEKAASCSFVPNC